MASDLDPIQPEFFHHSRLTGSEMPVVTPAQIVEAALADQAVQDLIAGRGYPDVQSVYTGVSDAAIDQGHGPVHVVRDPVLDAALIDGGVFGVPGLNRGHVNPHDGIPTARQKMHGLSLEAQQYQHEINTAGAEAARAILGAMQTSTEPEVLGLGGPIVQGELPFMTGIEVSSIHPVDSIHADAARFNELQQRWNPASRWELNTALKGLEVQIEVASHIGIDKVSEVYEKAKTARETASDDINTLNLLPADAPLDSALDAAPYIRASEESLQVLARRLVEFQEFNEASWHIKGKGPHNALLADARAQLDVLEDAQLVKLWQQAYNAATAKLVFWDRQLGIVEQHPMVQLSGLSSERPIPL